MPLILCWCRTDHVLARVPLSLPPSLLQPCLALNAEGSVPGFALCSFGFIVLGSVSKVYLDVCQKAPRCPIFTENQWAFAIKCFHLSLLKISPINNKPQSKNLVWEPRVCRLASAVGLAPRSQKVRKDTSYSNKLHERV